LSLGQGGSGAARSGASDRARHDGRQLEASGLKRRDDGRSGRGSANIGCDLSRRTATAAEGNWAGFWGADVVLQHLDELYKAGPFRIDPDYDKEKVGCEKPLGSRTFFKGREQCLGSAYSAFDRRNATKKPIDVGSRKFREL
jgi:hypothetical protein